MPAASAEVCGSGPSARRSSRASCTAGSSSNGRPRRRSRKALLPSRRLPLPQYGEEYFKQLTAERLVTFLIQGEPERRDPDRLVWSLDVRRARAGPLLRG
jgi:hypothetical protein